MGTRQPFKRKRTRIVETHPIGGNLTYDGNRLWTSAQSGQYKVCFKNAEIEDVWFKGKLLPRLVMRFEVLGGPMSMNEGGTWEYDTRNAGKVLALWESLGNDVDNPVLGPNSWVGSNIKNLPGNTPDERIKAWGKLIQYVVVIRSWKKHGNTNELGPASIKSISYKNPHTQPEVDKVFHIWGAADI